MLLSLLLPSYMVVSIRELANKHFSTNISHSISAHISKLLSFEEMDVNSNDNIRGRPTFPCKTNSRSSSVSSVVLSIPYHKKMKINNDIPNKNIVEPVDSLQLLYEESIG